MPKVWKQGDPKTPKNAIYVGRPSKWGNPYTDKPSGFAKFRVANRAEAVAAHKNWLLHSVEGRKLLSCINELRGRDLVCWCAPLACHADTLLALANAPVHSANVCEWCGDEFTMDDERFDPIVVRDLVTGKDVHICATCNDEDPAIANPDWDEWQRLKDEKSSK